MSKTTANPIYDPTSALHMVSGPDHDQLEPEGHYMTPSQKFKPAGNTLAVPRHTISQGNLTAVHTPTPAISIGNGSSNKDITKIEPLGRQMPRAIHRQNVIKELIDTEAVFERDMRIVQLVYKGTADACPGLDAQSAGSIFRNVDDIVSVHSHFLTQIKKALIDVYNSRPDQPLVFGAGDSQRTKSHNLSMNVGEANDPTATVGLVFKLNTEKMIVAHGYFLRQSNQAVRLLGHTQQDPGVKFWLRECREVSKHLTNAWDLDSLLIKPVQRITRYPLLISALLRHTPQDHPGWRDLLDARELLEKFLVKANTSKKSLEPLGENGVEEHGEPETKFRLRHVFGKPIHKIRAWSYRPTENTPQVTL